jgi:hypothetical protein
MIQAEARVAQLVEQRTENPCVAGSIPASGTLRNIHRMDLGLNLNLWWVLS